MKGHHAKRHRRQAKMKLRSGGKFKVGHASPAGRTGSIQSKHTVNGKPTHRCPHVAYMPHITLGIYLWGWEPEGIL